MPTNLELCDLFFAAISRGDIDAVRAIYAPDAVIWHNDEKAEQTPDRNLKVLGWVTRNIKDMRYEEVRRHETPTGFVEQHVLRGVAPNGAPLEIPACIVCEVREGRITRLDEYLDSAQTAALRS
ncbi:MAG: nuclear transport factor 2 family protein [Dehalococcoidia bacterium]|jgi:ketosteroid isomerase-like protein|nr:nuclear transport factor 2 family protein [Dehalococcoidia bacterium]